MNFRDIPGWTCPEMELFYHHALSGLEHGIFIEVGVAYGRSLALAAMVARQNVTIIGVDSWLEHMGGDNLPPDVFERQKSYGTPFDACEANLRGCGVRGRVSLIQSSSTHAAELFDDGECDVVFLDADHNYAAIAADINAWKPKVKPGGILAGHDYSLVNFPGVVRAVEEQFGRTRRVINGVVWQVTV